MTQRRMWTLTCGLSLLALLVLPGWAVAQQPVRVTINQIDVARFPDLTLYVTVNDDQGDPIQGLAQDVFQLTEDGSRVGGFTLSTVQEARLPLTLVLVLDISASMRGTPIAETKAAAAQFVAGLGADDRVALFAFGTEVTQIQDLTADKTALQERIASLEVDGRAALYEAIYQAASAVAPLTGRRAFVILTDGSNDSNLPRTRVQAIQAAKEAGAPGYGLGFGTADEVTLGRLATETGGQFLKQAQPSRIRALFTQLAGQLQSQYVLTYRSAIAPDQKRHEIAVQVVTPQGTASHSRSLNGIPVSASTGPLSIAANAPTPEPRGVPAVWLLILGLAFLVVGGSTVALSTTRKVAFVPPVPWGIFGGLGAAVLGLVLVIVWARMSGSGTPTVPQTPRALVNVPTQTPAPVARPEFTVTGVTQAPRTPTPDSGATATARAHATATAQAAAQVIAGQTAAAQVTATAIAAVAATRTAVAATQTATASATATPTEEPATSVPTTSPAITLIEPANGSSVQDLITFRWAWTGTLAPGEIFDVRVCKGEDCQPQFGKTNTSEIAWLWLPDAGLGTYAWQVVVIDAASKQVTAPASEVWRFRWTGGGPPPEGSGGQPGPAPTSTPR